MIKLICTVSALLVVLNALALRAIGDDQDVRVSAGLSSQRAIVGETLTLTVRIDGTRAAPAPELPTIDGFILTPLGGNDISSSTTITINGRTTENRTEAYVYRFQLVPQRAGAFSIPPISVTLNGKTYTSNPLNVRIDAAESDGLMSLKIICDQREAFVGEPIEVKIEWLTSRQPASAEFALLSGDTEIDWADAPESVRDPGSLNEIPFLNGVTTARMDQIEQDGQAFLRFTISKFVIPKRTGPLSLGPLSITSDLIVRRSRSLFEQDVTRRSVAVSKAVEITVKPLPEEGRPKNFNGLIGRYQISVAAAPTAVNVGDPITLSVTVTGPMIDRVKPIELGQQSSLNDTFRISDQVTTARRADSVQFTYTIRAKKSDVESIPPIELPFFDTRRGAFSIAKSESIPLEVDRTRIVTSADAERLNGALPQGEAIESQQFGIRHNIESPDALVDQRFSLIRSFQDPIVIGAAAAPPAAWALGASIVLMRRRQASGKRRAPRRIIGESQARLRRLELESPEAASEEIARALRRGVSAFANREGAGLTPSECEAIVSHISESIASQTRSILERCDAARFGGMSAADIPLIRQDAIAVLDSLAREAGRGRR